MTIQQPPTAFDEADEDLYEAILSHLPLELRITTTTEIDNYLKQFNTPEHRAAVDALFNATDEQLNQSFKVK